jgi:hypothetical protein
MFFACSFGCNQDFKTVVEETIQLMSVFICLNSDICCISLYFIVNILLNVLDFKHKSEMQKKIQVRAVKIRPFKQSPLTQSGFFKWSSMEHKFDKYLQIV